GHVRRDPAPVLLRRDHDQEQHPLREGRPALRLGQRHRQHEPENDIYYGAGLSPGDYPDVLARFVDPLLVAPSLDLHLLPLSPAVDAGLDLGTDAQGKPLSGLTDVDGHPRVQGIAINIGAHELGSGTLGVDFSGGPGLPLRLAPGGTLGHATLELDLPAASSVDVALYDVT